MERRFTKIKYDGKKVNLYYVVEANEDKHWFESIQQPTPEFVAALDKLVADVIVICELPIIYITGLKIRGVSLSWTIADGEYIMGAVITALKTLSTSNSPLTINTPHLPAEDYGGNNPNAKVLSADCCDNIKELIESAEGFLLGERSQANMFEN